MPIDPVHVVGDSDSFSCLIEVERGANIASLVSQDIELLAGGHSPEPVIDRGSSFLASGLTGWIDCFPSITRENAPVGMGLSDPIADHGELWCRPWELQARTRHRVVVGLDIAEMGVSATRSVEWLGDALEVVTRLESRSQVAIPFVMASHPLLACDDSTWVRLSSMPLRWEIEMGLGRRDESLDVLWPSESDGRRRWSALPAAMAAKVFVPWPETGVAFGHGGCAWTLDWVSAPEGWLGLWINKGAFPSDRPLEHWALEPTIGSSDSLDVSRRLGTSRQIEPGEAFEMRLRLTPGQTPSM